jgi:hypothetical protein
MNIDGDNFNEPSFDGFRVIAGPSQQVSQSGSMVRVRLKIYSYYLIPNQKETQLLSRLQLSIMASI